MLGRIRGSFPAKLLVALLLILTVAGGYAAATAADTTQTVRDDAAREFETDAQQAATATTQWLERVGSQANTVGSAVTATDGSEAAIREAVDRFERSHDRPAGIVGVGYREGGGYVAATNASMAGTDPATQDAPWVGAAGDGTGVSGVYSVEWYDSPVVAMVTPAGDGQVVVLMDLHRFTETVGPSYGNVVIANGDREIVASHNATEVGTSHRSVGGEITRLAGAEAGGETNASVMVMDERGMVMAFAPIEGAPWTLMLHEPTGAAFTTAETVQSGLVGVLFIGLVGLVIVGATIGSSTVISIRQLAQRADQMAGGDLDVPLASRRTDEFGSLYQSLATMRDNLDERITAAESAKQEAEQARQEAEQARQEAEREREEAEQFNEQLRETAGEYADVMQAVAAGDLTRRLDTAGRSDVMAEVGEEFNNTLRELEETTSALVAFAEDVGQTAVGVERRAEEVRAASEQVAGSIEDIQSGARDQDTSLEEVAREVESLSASAEEIAATTNDVAETSRRTAEAAEAGEAAATEAIDEMNEVVETTAEAATAIEALDEEMAQIGEIVDVIQDIAEETNMLALNASIEAARAGEGGDGGGQGFAVVADEVKNLSEETKESADEIEQRIAAVQSRTGDAVGTVGQAREAVQQTAGTVEDALSELETIAERVEDNDRSIQEISGVTSDQADSAQSASQRVDRVADISRDTVQEADEVSTAADQQTAAVEEVRSEVADLASQAESLQALLDQFTVGDGGGVGDHDPGADPKTDTAGSRPASADGGADTDHTYGGDY